MKRSINGEYSWHEFIGGTGAAVATAKTASVQAQEPAGEIGGEQNFEDVPRTRIALTVLPLC